MSAPIQKEPTGRGRDVASMYAPPWARDAATDAADSAIAATEKLRNALPPAPLLKAPERRRRGAAPFEGDIALRELRARPPLDPDAVPEPPVVASRKSTIASMVRLAGAVGLAGLAAVFVVNGVGSRQDTGGEAANSFWSRLFGGNVIRETLSGPKAVAERKAESPADRPVPMMERFAAATPAAEPLVTAAQQAQVQQPQVQQPQVQPAEAAAPAAPPPPVASVAPPEAVAPPAISPSVPSL